MNKTAPAAISVWRPLNLNTFLLGAPHYPEHVDESYWKRDAQRMAEAGFNTVRMGEFAWHIFEPRENTFDFDLFDRAISVLADEGIKTIMCTPTATPPRWLTYHYPEVLRTDRNGRQASHGSRQHADTTSPVYRQHSRRITLAMASHYRSHPHVIGWQTDNEFNTSTSDAYSEVTRREFQKFLEDRYMSINALNHAWGGDFWATAYDNFDQIVVPVDGAPVSCSPGHVQDFHRFLAFSVARFQNDQIEILRSANPGWFIFHNLGMLRDIDFRGDFSRNLDFLGFDIYPLLYDEHRRDGSAGQAQALHLDICRGLSGNFIVPEQQSGFGSQPTFSTLTPEPGEMRRMAYSSVARGADGILFFRWRPAHFGAEIYWMGIIDHDDVPRRRYEEAKQFAHEIDAIKGHILGTHVRMDVGIAGGDFDNQEAHQAYPMGLPSPQDEGTLLHSYCYERGIACGFIHPEDDLSRLKVLYVPHWLIWKDEWTEKLHSFAESGGTVILSARTGSRDANNHVIREAAPGKSLAALAGIQVEEFGRLTPPDANGLSNRGVRSGGTRRLHPAESAGRRYTVQIGNQEVVAAHMYEVLERAEGTDVIGNWSNRFLKGKAAITARSVGRGRVVYSGTYLTEPLINSLMNSEFERAGVEPLIKNKPKDVEVTLREADGRKLLFILNLSHEDRVVAELPRGATLVGREYQRDGGAILAGHECLVLLLDLENN